VSGTSVPEAAQTVAPGHTADGVVPPPTRGRPALIEAVVVALLVAVLATQLLRYPVADDSVDREYRIYAAHLAATGTLMPSARLPGYPAFMALASWLVPGPLGEAVFWAQFWLMLVCAVAGWAGVRRRFGPLTAALFLGLAAAPNVLVRWMALPLPDALFGLLAVAVLTGLGWWTLSARVGVGWRWLPPLGLAMLMLLAFQPTAAPLLLLALPAFLVALLAGCRSNGHRHLLVTTRTGLLRLVWAAVTLAAVMGCAAALLDTGAARFAADIVGYRVVVALPPASDVAAERRIEDAKRAFRRSQDQRIESARFGTYDRFDLLTALRPADVRAVWWGRLAANPAVYVSAVLDDVLRGHDYLTRQLVPFFGDPARLLPLSEPYPRDDGSPAGDLFRATGLLILDRSPPAHFPYQVEVANAVLRMVGVWGLAALGVWRCWRASGPAIVAGGTLLVGFALTAAATNTLHIRYLLPLVPFLWLLQAAGAAWIVRVLVGATSRAARVAEALMVALLVAFMVSQLLAAAATGDPDPDGYVSYARSLAEAGRMPSSGRMPGYPLFLALLLLTTDAPLSEAVFWAQLWLTVVFVAALWGFVRWRFGVLPAVSLLGIFAAPSYFMQMAVVMLPDAPYSILLLPLLLGAGWWTLADRPRGGWWWLLPFAGGTVALQAIRPTTFVIVALLAGALVAGLLVGRRFGGGERLARPPATVARAGALLMSALAALAVSTGLLDTGAGRQNAEILAYRVVTRLPAASDSPAEERIEAARRRFAAIEGQQIDDARFGTYERFNLFGEIHPDDAAAVWRARLAAHSALYAAGVIEEVRLGHHMLARVALPYVYEAGRHSLFVARYPRNDGSPEGDLFRRTGLIVNDGRPPPGHYPFEVATAGALLELLAIWGLLALGVVRAWRRDGALAVAFGLLMAAFVAAVATTNTIDPRYLLPFAPLVYLGQALGVTWIIERLAPAAVPSPRWAHGALAPVNGDVRGVAG